MDDDETPEIRPAGKKRLNPLNDFAIALGMGKKGDEIQLQGFLSAVLKRTGKDHLESVEIREDRDLPAEIIGGKSSKLDVLAHLTDGSRINVEVQLRNEHNMGRRSLYYWSEEYTRDFEAGGKYRELPMVIAINIVDFGYIPVADFHTSFHIWEDQHKEILLTDALEIHFLDMVKFRRLKAGTGAGHVSLEDPLHRWLVYFDEHSSPDIIEEVLRMDPTIQKLQEKMDMIQRDPGLLRSYRQYEKAVSDYASGIYEARLEGIQEGELKGKLEGKQEKAITIAQKMKATGESAEKIAHFTDLSLEEIEGL
jgi:predicted transposase/invertase (TIGR01784 family)